NTTGFYGIVPRFFLTPHPQCPLQRTELVKLDPCKDASPISNAASSPGTQNTAAISPGASKPADPTPTTSWSANRCSSRLKSPPSSPTTQTSSSTPPPSTPWPPPTPSKL